MSNIDQHAHGSNINQAGGDINIVTPRPVVRDRLIECPACKWGDVDPLAHACPACHYPIREHFEEIARYEEELKRKKADEKLMKICISFFAIGLFGFLGLSRVDFPKTIENVLFWIFGIIFFMAFAIANNASRRK